MTTTGQEEAFARWDIYLKYLKLYVDDIDWAPQLEKLEAQLSKKNQMDNLKKQVACTILLPTYDKSKLTDPPENLLFQVGMWHQINERNWIEEMRSIKKQDDHLDDFAEELLDLGIVHPLEYYPATRQAFNWLFDAAKYSNIERTVSSNAEETFRNLVYVYGGAVICSIFGKPELENRIKKLHNWRSAYFFRRLIHEVYSDKDILKIKSLEITKLKKADSKLVKMVKKEKNNVDV